MAPPPHPSTEKQVSPELLKAITETGSKAIQNGQYRLPDKIEEPVSKFNINFELFNEVGPARLKAAAAALEDETAVANIDALSNATAAQIAASNTREAHSAPQLDSNNFQQHLLLLQPRRPYQARRSVIFNNQIIRFETCFIWIQKC